MREGKEENSFSSSHFFYVDLIYCWTIVKIKLKCIQSLLTRRSEYT